MSGLKRLWIRIVAIVEAWEGADDPTGDYMLSLGARVDKLERDLGSCNWVGTSAECSRRQYDSRCN